MNLSEKAVLARLSSSLPGEARQDKALTREVQDAHSMGKEAGRWVKRLFPPVALEKVKVVVGEARTAHYKLTLPWDDAGFRILPTSTYLDYQEAMRQFKAQFATERDAFDARWEDWIAWARTEQNGSFDITLYDRAKCRDHFEMKADFQPIPSGSDFRVALQSEDVAIMRKDLDGRMDEAVKAAQADLWRRLAEPLGHMVQKLKDPKGIFRDTLVTNLQDIVEMIPKLNLTGDAKLAAFAQEVDDKLLGVSPETLRKQPIARNATAQAAEEILARVNGLIPQ
jgi:hypothetical protein